MKKANEEKELMFIDNFVSSGNAKQSCINAGYNPKTATSRGHQLKNKFLPEIQQKQLEKLSSMTGKALGTLEGLMNAEQDSVKLNACKLVLDCNGFVGNTNLNVKFDKNADKTDEQLKQELKDLLEKNKDLKDLFH